MRVRCALGLLVALLLAGCGEDEPRDRAAARTKATPTASPTPTPTPDSGRLTDAQVAALDRADKRVRRTDRAYARAMRRAHGTRCRPRVRRREYRPHSRAMRRPSPPSRRREAAAKQCRAQLEDAEDSRKRCVRATRSSAPSPSAGTTTPSPTPRTVVDAEMAYEDAFEQIVSVCEDI